MLFRSTVFDSSEVLDANGKLAVSQNAIGLGNYKNIRFVELTNGELFDPIGSTEYQNQSGERDAGWVFDQYGYNLKDSSTKTMLFTPSGDPSLAATYGQQVDVFGETLAISFGLRIHSASSGPLVMLGSDESRSPVVFRLVDGAINVKVFDVNGDKVFDETRGGLETNKDYVVCLNIQESRIVYVVDDVVVRDAKVGSRDPFYTKTQVLLTGVGMIARTAEQKADIRPYFEQSRNLRPIVTTGQVYHTDDVLFDSQPTLRMITGSALSISLPSQITLKDDFEFGLAFKSNNTSVTNTLLTIYNGQGDIAGRIRSTPAGKVELFIAGQSTIIADATKVDGFLDVRVVGYCGKKYLSVGGVVKRLPDNLTFDLARITVGSDENSYGDLDGYLANLNVMNGWSVFPTPASVRKSLHLRAVAINTDFIAQHQQPSTANLDPNQFNPIVFYNAGQKKQSSSQIPYVDTPEVMGFASSHNYFYDQPETRYSGPINQNQFHFAIDVVSFPATMTWGGPSYFIGGDMNVTLGLRSIGVHKRTANGFGVEWNKPVIDVDPGTKVDRKSTRLNSSHT